MAKRTPPTYPLAQRVMADMGKRLQIARISRKMTQAMMAERVGVSRHVLGKLEAGDPTTSLATLMRVLAALGMVDYIKLIAADDPHGRALAESSLKRSVSPAPSVPRPAPKLPGPSR